MKPKPARKPATAPADQRVLIVEDHPIMRLGLQAAISAEPGLTVCCTAASAAEALAAVEKGRPDIVVTDLNMPGRSGLELIKDLASLCPGLPVIVLSLHDEEVYAERCLRAGARGYLMKAEGPEKLTAAIRKVLAGEVYLTSKVSARIIAAFTGRSDPGNGNPLNKLSDRELEVLGWIGRGLTTQEIAGQLHISPKTVETHRMKLRTKLGLTSSPELIAYAARWVAASG